MILAASCTILGKWFLELSYAIFLFFSFLSGSFLQILGHRLPYSEQLLIGILTNVEVRSVSLAHYCVLCIVQKIPRLM